MYPNKHDIQNVTPLSLKTSIVRNDFKAGIEYKRKQIGAELSQAQYKLTLQSGLRNTDGLLSHRWATMK